MPAFAAVDIGASGGRVMAGVVERDRVTLEAVHRFANGVAEVDGHLRWDFTTLYGEVVAGLERVPEALSIGIDTWAIDYGLLDGDGNLLAEPIAYRDGRTAKVIDEVHAVVPPDELYAINGLQFLPFNTIYQLAAERDSAVWPDVAHAVLVPDLVAHGLTGELRTELTNASTTGLVDARSRQWSTELFSRLDLPASLLPPLQPPGEVRGLTSAGMPVIAVGSHDTASAVVGVPATTERFAYIASGTWSLVGLELPAPVLTEAARAANFTNEIGVDGRTRFLRNVGGLWLLQESMREWQRDDLADLLAAAGQLAAGGPIIDVDDPAFIPPGRMPDRIAAAAGRPAMTEVETTRCILDSLAAGYAHTVERASALAGREVDVIHVVGGGSQNAVLCQLTADAAGVPVLAGPVEATALGNVLVQARAHGAVSASLEAMRSTIAASFALQRYEPR
jgi:rhamnulokinase